MEAKLRKTFCEKYHMPQSAAPYIETFFTSAEIDLIMNMERLHFSAKDVEQWAEGEIGRAHV